MNRPLQVSSVNVGSSAVNASLGGTGEDTGGGLPVDGPGDGTGGGLARGVPRGMAVEGSGVEGATVCRGEGGSVNPAGRGVPPRVWSPRLVAARDADARQLKPSTPAGIAPSGITPTGIGPSGIASTGSAPSKMSSSGIAPSRRAPPCTARPGGAPPGIRTYVGGGERLPTRKGASAREWRCVSRLVASFARAFGDTGGGETGGNTGGGKAGDEPGGRSTGGGPVWRRSTGGGPVWR